MNSWHSALLGAAETMGGNNVGAMIGARGCVTQIVAPASGVPSQYQVAVAWQGLNNTAAPAVACGAGQYGNAALRRVVAIPVTIADLN
jgi:type IV pilus assembly protein PilV